MLMEFETERAAAALSTARATVDDAALPVLQELPLQICLSNADVGWYNTGCCKDIMELARVLTKAINGQN